MTRPEIDFTNRYWGEALSWVGPGWQPIVLDLDQRLRAEAPGFTYGQIKEKFGGLRIYLHFGEDVSEEIRARARELVHEAVGKAAKICEECGKPGALREERAWRRTLCDECDKTAPVVTKMVPQGSWGFLSKAVMSALAEQLADDDAEEAGR